jgi:hypothetical protein
VGEREAGGEPGERRGQRGGAGETERTLDGAGDVPGESARRGAPQGEPGSRGLEGLREQLERMSSPTGGASEKREAADELRRQAERLLEQASPEERERMERMAREMQDRMRPSPGERGAPPRISPGSEQAWETEAFDARAAPGEGDAGPQEVIAEWFGEGDVDRPEARGSGAGAPLRQAAAGAERAIDRQAVPRARSDLVRRVFERFQRRAAGDGEQVPPREGD